MHLPELTFRKATETDIDYLLWLRTVTMNPHLVSSGLPVTKEKHLERIRYQLDHANIIMIDGQKAGLIKVVEHPTYTEIIQIQIDPGQQGKGIGREILRSIVTKSLDKHLPVVLSVLRCNPAIRLYQRIGFRIVEENEDSFVMRIEGA